jgi:toxin FitB
LEVLTLFDGRVLAFDSDCAHPLGIVIAKANKGGNRIGFPDAAIAAISLLYGFQVATRNVSDFAATGIKNYQSLVARRLAARHENQRVAEAE